MEALFFVARCLARVRLLSGKNVCHCYMAAVSGVVGHSLQLPHASERSRKEVEALIDDWVFWEKRYVAYGYYPLSLKGVEDLLRKRQNIHDPHLNVRLDPGDTPILYAPRYRENFLEEALR